MNNHWRIFIFNDFKMVVNSYFHISLYSIRFNLDQSNFCWKSRKVFVNNVDNVNMAQRLYAKRCVGEIIKKKKARRLIWDRYINRLLFICGSFHPWGKTAWRDGNNQRRLNATIVFFLLSTNSVQSFTLCVKEMNIITVSVCSQFSPFLFLLLSLSLSLSMSRSISLFFNYWKMYRARDIDRCRPTCFCGPAKRNVCPVFFSFICQRQTPTRVLDLLLAFSIKMSTSFYLLKCIQHLYFYSSLKENVIICP